MSERTAFPLSWPEGWKRTQRRTRAQFKHYRTPLSVNTAVQRLLYELQRMGVSDYNVIISTNVPLRLDGFPRSDKEPADPGAAVYWRHRNWKEGQPLRCMAIDRYDRVADNLAALAATLEAMRAIERHGGATILDRAFLGFAALPEKASQPWREVFGIAPGVSVTLELVETRFKNMAQIHHPDKGGNREHFERIVQAREAARMELSA